MFNILYINDIFYFIHEYISNYADDTTPYAVRKNYDESLQLEYEILTIWFKNNFFKLNPDKCKLLISDKENDLSINIDGETIVCEKSVKLLGIKIDNRLTFNEHISSICKKKVSCKLHALARISSFMKQDKSRLIMKAFIESLFSYCPMVWMFHSRTLDNRINELHERALRLVYKDHNSTFNQLLLHDKSYTIHDRNLQKLAIEMYKVKHDLSPAFMHTIFPSLDNNYNLRYNRDFKTRHVHSIY